MRYICYNLLLSVSINIYCQSAVRHQTIIWTNVDVSSMEFCSIHLRTISQPVPKLLFCIRSLKINYTFKITAATFPRGQWVNLLWPSEVIWQKRSWSILAQVKPLPEPILTKISFAIWLTAPSHCLNQCWLIISKVEWHSSKASSQEITQPSTTEMIWKSKYLKFHSNFPGVSELIFHPHLIAGISNTMILFCAALTDHKLLFHSQSYHRLTFASHAITALMYPLKYR